MNRILSIVCGLFLALSASALDVTDYGAVGDAVQLYVNCTSNSVVVTTTNTLDWPASSNKTVELFGVGAFTTPTNNQDLIAIITNVVNGTNVCISGDIPQVTSNGVYCIYGTQNAPAFQAAVNAASGTNTIINIPAGNYLMIPPCQYTNFNNGLPYPNYMLCNFDQAITIRKGGIHFVGAGRDLTILTGDGAWKNQGGYCARGMVFNCIGPTTNNYPLIWDSLTFDGGLQYGLTGNQGIQPASPTTGIGWDGTSAAGLDSGSEPFCSKVFQNCKFQHFRGEIIKSITGSGGGNATILVTNCVFTDGNATAFNYSFPHNITDCVFSNLYEVMEFYEAYATNVSYFQNCIATNITGGIMAINGALTNSPNPTYTIRSNLFYFTGQENGIQTTPAQNVVIIGNRFVGMSGLGMGVTLGVAGYQGSAPNSNIVIAFNNFTNIFYAIIVEGSGENSIYNVQVISNTASVVNLFTTGYGWSTNVSLFGNVASGGGVDGSQLKGQWFLDDLSNQYGQLYKPYDYSGVTNSVFYSHGARQNLEPENTNSVWVLDDTTPAKIPPGAKLVLTQISSSNPHVPLYLSTSMSGTAITMTNGTMQCFSWTGSQWTQDGWIDPRARVHW